MNRRHTIACLAITGLVMSLPALAQAPFPSKPIRLITLTTAGGSLDILARLTAQKLSEQMGTSVVVENRVGAGGNPRSRGSDGLLCRSHRYG